MKVTVELERFDKEGDIVTSDPIIMVSADETGDDNVRMTCEGVDLILDRNELLEALSKFV